MAKAPAGASPGMNWVWVGAAVVVIAGFLLWLSLAAEPSAVATVAENQDTAAEEAPFAGQVVDGAQFEGQAAQLMGQEVELANVLVQSRMGPQVLWVELPSGPYMVKVDAAAAQGIAENTRVTVRGRVLAKTDSVLNAWQESGVIQSEGHRAQAEYGTSFIEATRVRPASS